MMPSIFPGLIQISPVTNYFGEFLVRIEGTDEFKIVRERINALGLMSDGEIIGLQLDEGRWHNINETGYYLGLSLDCDKNTCIANVPEGLRPRVRMKP